MKCKMLWEYIKSHRMNLYAWTAVCITFALVFSLYGLPAEAVLYGAALSGFFGLIFAVSGYISCRRKRILLKRLAGEIIYTADDLPDGDGIEGDYISLIRILCNNHRTYENEMTAKFSDMTDYYTLWAHQIKTPIAAADLVLQSLQGSDNGDNAELACIKENLRSISRYTEMALVFLRLDSEYTDFIIKEYDLDGIIRQAVRKFSPQFIGRKLSLKYEPIEKKVLTDEKWLLFVIEQIISNAVKYTHRGGAEIYCEEPLTLCIKDTGIGIAPEDMQRIFDKGYTGCNGRIDKKASGIGLYLCRRICQMLGHEISAQSNENGTVIKIDLSADKINIE